MVYPYTDCDQERCLQEYTVLQDTDAVSFRFKAFVLFLLNSTIKILTDSLCDLGKFRCSLLWRSAVL